MSEVPYGAPTDDAWIEDASLPTLKRTHYLERVFGEEPPQGYAEWIKSLSLTSVEMEYFKRKLLGQLIDKLLITGVVPFTSDLPQSGNNNGDIWFVESDGHAHLWLDGNYYDLGDLKGVKGDQGIQGIQGEVGPIGPKGDQGIQGIKGDTGETGAQGIQGPKGDTGLTGPKGDQGIQGIPGENGADGTSVTIKGSVSTSAELPPTGNSNGDGWITQGDGHLHVWNGTAFVDVGLVRGPKGDKGDTGAQGIQGIQGIPGVKGDTGDQGIQGTQGVKGDQGEIGPIGPKGDTGDGITYLSTAPNAEAKQSTYPIGYSYFVLASNSGTGWPIGYFVAETVNVNASRCYQTLRSTNGKLEYYRTVNSGTGEWNPFEIISGVVENTPDTIVRRNIDGTFNVNFDPLADNHPASKRYVDRSNTLGYKNKSYADLPGTYPEGVTVGLFANSEGWPTAKVQSGTSFTVVETHRPRGYSSVIQYMYPYVNSASTLANATKYLMRYGSDSTGWGPDIASTNVNGYIDPKALGAVGDGVADDTEALQSAISLSISSGLPVYLGSDIFYASTLSSTYWSTTYLGSGGIRVGTATTSYRPNPSNNGYTCAVYYDNNLGSDSNSGLDPAKPIKTFSRFNSMMTIYANKAGTSRLGMHRLIVKNGVHVDKFTSLGFFPLFSSRFFIEGESRDGAIIDGTGTSNSVGIWFEPNSYVGIRNLTIRNFKSPNTEETDDPDNGAAIVIKGGGNGHVENVVIEDCSQGVGFINNVQGSLTKSFIRRCGTGVRVLYSSSAIIGGPSSTYENIIEDCTTHGVFLSRNAVAHVDYNIIQRCAVGLSVNMAARVATLGGSFLNNELGVMASGAGEMIISDYSVFTGNTRDRAYYGVGRETRIHGNSPTTNEWCLHKASVPYTLTGSTSNTTVAIDGLGSSIFVYPRHHTTSHSKLKMVIKGSTSGAGTKTLRFYGLNPTNSTQINQLANMAIPSTHTGRFELVLESYGNSNTTAKGFATLLVDGASIKLGTYDASINTSYKWMFRLMAQLSDASGSVTVDSTEIYLMG